MASSFEAHFTMTGLARPLRVLTSRVSFSQPVNRQGRPTAGVRSGQISVHLMGDDEAQLTQWAIDPMKSLGGSITYIDPETRMTFRTLTFRDTYCVSYHEIFTIGDSVGAYTFELGLTARELHVDSNLHDNMWSNWIPGQG
ncbi:hypothetical protein J2I47_03795 [Fibrella sp. HMF5335]|uniref:Uncharacterized protein n=1 Tax=Fibrella rubiginis TaxID=2817060 RepID=A0A939K3I2_9BACT|nr:type VI secretion system tube protein TssD [Fibrella rubiginis]MBO0935663.1 hypothetical protein [Fibrella rubiginis]